MVDFPIENRRVLIVGGAGFIGHNLAIDLKKRGAHVTVIDGLQVNNLGAITSADPSMHNRDLYLRIIRQRMELLEQHNIPLIVQDARDYHAMSYHIAQLKPQVLVHLAAVSHANRSNKDPHSTFDHSLRTLENSLDAARGVVEQFIFFSSSMVYGNFETPSVDEDSPLNPLGIYGALKLAGEKMVIAYNQVFGLPYTIIRPSALYGQRCVSRRVGQIFIESALQGATLRIDGDGQEFLDFTYIQDLVNGVVASMQTKNALNQIFNLTYGESRTILDLALIVKEQFPKVQMTFVERDNLMPFRGTLKVDKARDLIGYIPSYPIDRGIPEYIEWYKSLYPSA
jgi:nucleoside-diphosphate-sugar epimerase